MTIYPQVSIVIILSLVPLLKGLLELNQPLPGLSETLENQNAPSLPASVTSSKPPCWSRRTGARTQWVRASAELGNWINFPSAGNQSPALRVGIFQQRPGRYHWDWWQSSNELNHEPTARWREGEHGHQGCNPAQLKEARGTERSLIRLPETNLLKGHDCTEEAPKQQTFPFKPSSKEKKTTPSQDSGCAWFLKGEVQMSWEMTFQSCKMCSSFGGTYWLAIHGHVASCLPAPNQWDLKYCMCIRVNPKGFFLYLLKKKKRGGNIQYPHAIYLPRGILCKVNAQTVRESFLEDARKNWQVLRIRLYIKSPSFSLNNNLLKVALRHTVEVGEKKRKKKAYSLIDGMTLV